MFENLKKNVVKKTTRKPNNKELPRTSRFVGELAKVSTRLTYAGLATAATALGEHTPSGLSAGQRGAQITKNLPAHLQPFICRSNGGYAKGTEWVVDGETVTAQAMKALDFVPPAEVMTYVGAFEAATAETVEETETETEEPESEVEETEAEDNELWPSLEEQLQEESEDEIDESID